MKTGYGLVAHARMALAEHWAYTRGSYGKVLTIPFLEEILKRLPEVKIYEAYIRANNIGRRSVDCVGLMKSYMWWNKGAVDYDAKTDINADMAFANSETKGLLTTIPERPGVCVYHVGHIGVYDGKGWVIESKGTMFGVVRTPLTGTGSNNWTNWLEFPGIDYKSWVQVTKMAVDDYDLWVKAVNSAVAVSKADGSLGDLEIFKYLPDLIMKLYSL